MTYGILIPEAGIEPMPRPKHWKCRVLTTGPLGKSQGVFFSSLFVLRLMTSSYSIAPVVLLLLDFKTFCSTFHLLHDFTNFDHPDFSAFFF